MKILLLILVVGSIFYSCNERDVNQEFSVKQVASETQRIELNIEKDSLIYSKNGTILIFPQNCLDQATGMVIVKLQEYYNLSDMLLGNLTTTSGQRILETDGMINITIETETGKEVCLANGKSFKIQMPKTKDDMSLFYGKMKSKSIDWSIAEKPYKIEKDSMPSYQKDGTFNYFESTKLGWINADKFIDFKKKTDLIVSLPESQSDASCNLVIDKYNSIIPGIVENGRLLFKGIPANTKATLVALGANKKSQFLCIKDLNTNDKFVELPLLHPMATKEIKFMLEKQFGKNLK